MDDIDRRDFSRLLALLGGGAALVAHTRDADADPPAAVNPRVRAVEHLAALREQAGTVGCMIVLGARSPADDGGGVFAWTHDTVEADDGGTVIVPTASPRVGCWKRTAREALNVRWFGAMGDGRADDTAALNAAIAVANTRATAPSHEGETGNRGPGSTVYLPAGTYRVTAAITPLASGVGLQGAGRRASRIVFEGEPRPYGLSWRAPVDYGRGGSLRDLDLEGGGCVDVGICIEHWAEFDIRAVRVIRARRYGLKVTSAVFIQVRDAAFLVCGTPAERANSGGAWVDAATTVSFDACYFQYCYGAGADVAGQGIGFSQCVFESNGNGEATSAEAFYGHGIKVRSGTVSFVAPYFENNAGHEMLFGSEARAHVVVVNPFVSCSHATKNVGAGLAVFDHVMSGSLTGGDLSQALGFAFRFTGNSANVAVVGVCTGSLASTYTMTGDIADYPGLLQLNDTASPYAVRLTGAWEMQAGGTHAARIVRHLSADAPWTPGAVAVGASVSTVVGGLVGAQLGDTVAVGFGTPSEGLPPGVLLSGSVTAIGVHGAVTVTLSNLSGTVQTLGAGTVRADVWHHRPTPAGVPRG